MRDSKSLDFDDGKVSKSGLEDWLQLSVIEISLPRFRWHSLAMRGTGPGGQTSDVEPFVGPL
jgi:hypothetical protein